MAITNFEIKANVKLGTGIKVFRDKSINDNSSVIDMSSEWAGGNKSSFANNDNVKNLAYIDDPATVLLPTKGTDQTVDNSAVGTGGGVTFSGGTANGGNGTGVKLPTSFNITADVTKFFFSFWFKCTSPTGQISKYGNYNWFYIGSGSGADTENQTALLRSGWSGGSTKTIFYPTELFVYGIYLDNPAAVNTALNALKGKVTNLAIEVIYEKATNLFYVKYFVNGQFITNSSTLTPRGMVTATSAYALTGPQTSTGLIDTVFYRARLDNLSSSTLDSNDIAYTEYYSNKGYFS